MANPGDRFEMVDGSVYEVLETSGQTGGQYVEMIFHQPPGAIPPPPHVHSKLVEEYEVIEGRFDVMVEGEWRTLGPGESASVPEGALHTFRNRSGSVVRARNFHRPAARFEDYIEHIYRLMRARRVKRKTDPRVPIYLSMLMLEYPETLAPGRRRERVGMKALAGLGRLLRMSTAV
jgi:mannose-6-phosphate isomerase-like protein (cupin superfamily)